MAQHGIARVTCKNGKIKNWTMFEDPTMFVEMAMKGKFSLNK